VATNTVTHQPVFSRIIITDDITYPQLQFGKDFSVALRKDGTLWAWGNNRTDVANSSIGLTGTGSKQKYLTIPVQIDQYYASASDAANGVVKPLENILSIAVGDTHVIAIGESGRVYAWGDNTYGQLGINPAAAPGVDRPLLVEINEEMTALDENGSLARLSDNNKIIDVSAGGYHTVAVAATGEVYAWGRNNVGQLGRKTITADNDVSNYKPEKIKGLGEGDIGNVVMSAASKEATALLLANGNVYTVGGNSHGELGTGLSRTAYPYQTQIARVSNIRVWKEQNEQDEDLTDVTRIVGRGYNFAAISTKLQYKTEDGKIVRDENGNPIYEYIRNRKVYTWGDGSTRQLGTGTFTDAYSGRDYNVDAVLSDPTTWYSNQPVEVRMDAQETSYNLDENGNAGASLHNIANISIGYYEDEDGTLHTHMLALNRHHVAFGWGANENDEIGIGSVLDQTSARRIKTLYQENLGQNGQRIIGIASGGMHSGAFDLDGIVTTWGYNKEGQLGDFSTTNRMYPVLVDEEYIALGNYDIVLEVDSVTGASLGSVIVPAAYMMSFSLDKQIDFAKTAQITYKTFNEEIATVAPATGDLSNYTLTTGDTINIAYMEITPQHYGETKLIVEYENPINGEKMSAVANIIVISNASDYVTSPAMGNGDGFTVALKADGTVWSWGLNNNGALGQGLPAGSRNIIPTEVTFDGLESGAYIKKISVGKAHVLALDSTGNVWAWGDNSRQQLGVLSSETLMSLKPIRAGVIGGHDYIADIKQVYEIADIFATETGSFLITGGNSDVKIDKLDNGTRILLPLAINRNTYAFGQEYDTYNLGYVGEGYGAIPTQLSIVKRVSKIDGGYVLKASGTVWELPTDPESPTFNIFDQIDNIVDISSVSALEHTLVLDAEGSVYAWGQAGRGELGNGVADGSSTVVQVVDTDNEPLTGVIAISAGKDHSSALVNTKVTIDGNTVNKGIVYTWGDNVRSELGNENLAGGGYVSRAQNVKYSSDATSFSIIGLEAGYDTTSTLQSTGYMWTFGYNNNGQLGNLDNANSAVPVLVGRGELEVAPTELTIPKDTPRAITYSSTGVGTLLKLTSSDAFNLLGITGTGMTGATFESLNTNILTVTAPAAGSSDPYVMTGLKSGKANLVVESGGTYAYIVVTVLGDNADDLYTPMVAAGENHTVVLKANGTVWTWGSNDSSQLGRTSTGSVAQVTLPEAATYIAAGKNASYAIGESGKLYAWGDNTFDQLGNTSAGSGTMGATVVTVKAPGGTSDLTDVKEISVRDNSLIILTADGTVYGLGEMFVSSARKITQIPNLSGVVQLSGIYARTTNGTVWQIQPSGSPQKIAIKTTEGSDAQIIKIAAGKNHLIALDNEKKLWAFGSNSEGQIGNSDSAALQAVPVKDAYGNDITDVNDIAAGDDTSYAIKTEGMGLDERTYVYAWGANDSGQAGQPYSGDSAVANVTSATRLTSSPYAIQYLYAGYKQAYIIDESGRVWGIGENTEGQLADGDTIDASSFVICGDSQIEINKVNASGSVLASGYGTIYFTEGEEGYLKASFDAFNVYTQAADASSNYDFTFDTYKTSAGMDTVFDIRNQTELANSNIVKDGNNVKALSEGIVYVKVSESTLLNKTSYAKIVVLPALVSYSFQPKVSAGENHTMTLRYDGTLWGFGANDNGQLGIENYDSIDTPTQAIAPGRKFIDVAAGTDHTAAIASDGRMYVTGNNDRHQLGMTLASGTKTYDFTYLPVTFDDPLSEKFVAVEAGNGFTIAITNKGNVYGWGDNSYGQLGLGDDTYIAKPQKISVEHVRNISAGKQHSLFVQMDGTVYAAGNYEDNRLGLYNLQDNVTVPTKVAEFDKQPVVKASAGGDYSFVLKYDTSAAAVGKNSVGQLGIGNTLSYTSMQPVNKTDLYDISAGDNHAMAIDSTGKLYVWGDNTYGQLGKGGMTDGTITLINTPEDNPTFLNGVVVRTLSAGNGYSVFSDASGVVYGMGDYTQGDADRFNLASIETRGDTPVMIGESRLVTSDNEVLVKANGTPVQLHIPDVSKFNLLVDYNNTSTLDVKSINTNIAAVTKQTSATTGQEEVFVQGKDLTGLTQVIIDREIKDGQGTLLSTERFVYFVTNIENKDDAIVSPMTASGQLHTIVLKQDGSVWAFGDNTYGQLGLGTTYTVEMPTGTQKVNTVQHTPQRITFFDRELESNEYIVKVYAGEYHSAALTNTGRVFTWGLNNRGQLGLGYEPNIRDYVTAPEQVTVKDSTGKFVPLKGISKLSLGSFHTVALTESGLVYAWGWNEYKQLGNESVIAEYAVSPVAVQNLNKVVDISRGSGGQTSYAIRYDGSVWGWGDNAGGQVDVSKATSARLSKPTQVELKSTDGTDYGDKVIRIYNGLNHSAALLNDGTVITWGQNTQSQLGRVVTTWDYDVNSRQLAKPGLVDLSNIDSNNNYVVDIAVGANHNLAMFSNQTVGAWGDGDNGRLGLGTDAPQNAVQYVKITDAGATPETLKALTMSTGGAFSVYSRAQYDSSALELGVKNGMMYGTGLNDRGQLALGTAIDSMSNKNWTLSPVIIAGDGAKVVPSSTTIQQNAQRNITVTLPRFYITGQNKSGTDFTATTQNVYAEGETPEAARISYNAGKVIALNKGKAILIIQDNETSTQLIADFTVVDQEAYRISELDYIVPNPDYDETNPTSAQTLTTVGEVKDTDWFLDRGFLKIGTDYTMELAYDENGNPINDAAGVQISTPMLYGDLTQFYAVENVIITDDRKATIRVYTEFTTTENLTLRDENGLAVNISDPDAANYVGITVKTDPDKDNAEYYELTGVPVDEVVLYYLDFTNKTTNDKVTTKLAIIGKSDNTDLIISVVPRYADEDPSALTIAETHRYMNDAFYIPGEIKDAEGNTTGYYYIAADKNINDYDLIGATVYIQGQKASVVSIADIAVNSDHDAADYHAKYFDAQYINIGGTDPITGDLLSGNETVKRLTVVAQDGETKREYMLYIFKRSYATSLNTVTLTDKTNSNGKTYTAVQIDDDTYRVVIPANIGVADITTTAMVKYALVDYKGDTYNNAITDNATPAVYTDYVLDNVTETDAAIYIHFTGGGYLAY
ncbi:MAG: hypothetical protein IJG16_02410, partial [Clostridia bacterium]|nr:hypothetical protein [Clostridia bacterium]